MLVSIYPLTACISVIYKQIFCVTDGAEACPGMSVKRKDLNL